MLKMRQGTDNWIFGDVKLNISIFGDIKLPAGSCHFQGRAKQNQTAIKGFCEGLDP